MGDWRAFGLTKHFQRGREHLWNEALAQAHKRIHKAGEAWCGDCFISRRPRLQTLEIMKTAGGGRQHRCKVEVIAVKWRNHEKATADRFRRLAAGGGKCVCPV